MFAFSSYLRPLPPRRGFALQDAIRKQVDGGTEMWKSIRGAAQDRHNRIMVVITDEQTKDSGTFSDANSDLLVIVNIASNENGVGYGKGIVHIDGWSDSTVTWLREYLKEGFDKL